jgi:DNA-directed RNA polymerase subunit alpha
MHSAVTGLLKPQLVEVVSKSINHSRIVLMLFHFQSAG